MVRIAGMAGNLARDGRHARDVTEVIFAGNGGVNGSARTHPGGAASGPSGLNLLRVCRRTGGGGNVPPWTATRSCSAPGSSASPRRYA
ncbi:protein of unknown function [Streptantibioticus cattleyicolor NRRL 8057 = DSM 46488]|nr:protein of unknown function [Streptantibioticus cattleyicolor NRRL 8057 = DSM 46488]